MQDVPEPRDSAAQAAAAAIPSGVARRLTAFDRFLLVNVAMFVAMCGAAYWERWNRYMGPGRMPEFLLCAAAIVVALVLGRRLLPREPFPPRLLLVAQAGITAHFAGGFVRFGESRLYDVVLVGVRYDKFVHAGNSWIAGAAIVAACAAARIPRTPIVRALSVFAVLGLGAVVEIAEFIVTRTVERHGIGGYDDTMGDLIANVAGALLLLATEPWVSRTILRRGAP